MPEILDRPALPAGAVPECAPVRCLHHIRRAVARIEPVKPKPPSPPTPSVVHLSRRVPAMIWQSANQPRRQPARVTRSSTKSKIEDRQRR